MSGQCERSPQRSTSTNLARRPFKETQGKIPFSVKSPKEPRCRLVPDSKLPSKQLFSNLPRTLVIPDTCPTRTARLWRAVRNFVTAMGPKKLSPGFMQQTASSKAKAKRSRPTDDTRACSSQAASSSTISTIKAKVYDRDFRDTVLRNCRINIDANKYELRSPFEHFGGLTPTRVSTQPAAARYHCRKPDLSPGLDNDIWMDHAAEDAQEIAMEYADLVRLKENEAQFEDLGRRSFFRQNSAGRRVGTSRSRVAYRKLNWGPDPDPLKHLVVPPVLGSPEFSKLYDFKLKPDLTYWLLDTWINPDYKRHLKGVIYVIEEVHALAPYLTVEFKKDKDNGASRAENQVAAASAVFIYSRYKLREAALRAKGLDLKLCAPTLFADIRHYGITFTGYEATIWIMEPVVEFTESEDGATILEWQGCKMQRLDTQDATSMEGVLNIQDWVNEIHYWGLVQWADCIAMDVRDIFVRHAGGLGVVSSTPEELEAQRRALAELGLRDGSETRSTTVG